MQQSNCQPWDLFQQKMGPICNIFILIFLLENSSYVLVFCCTHLSTLSSVMVCYSFLQCRLKEFLPAFNFKFNKYHFFSFERSLFNRSIDCHWRSSRNVILLWFRLQISPMKFVSIQREIILGFPIWYIVLLEDFQFLSTTVLNIATKIPIIQTLNKLCKGFDIPFHWKF